MYPAGFDGRYAQDPRDQEENDRLINSVLEQLLLCARASVCIVSTIFVTSRVLSHGSSLSSSTDVPHYCRDQSCTSRGLDVGLHGPVEYGVHFTGGWTVCPLTRPLGHRVCRYVHRTICQAHERTVRRAVLWTVYPKMQA